MGEGVGSDDGLVGGGAEADAAGEELAGGVELVHDDVVGVRELVATDGEDGGELLESGVAARARPIPLTAHSACPHSSFYGGQSVGDGEAEVVVTVGGEDDVFSASMRGDAIADHGEHGGIVLRDAVADGVGEVECGGSGLDGDLADLDEEVGVGAGGVLRGRNSTSST